MLNEILSSYKLKQILQNIPHTLKGDETIHMSMALSLLEFIRYKDDYLEEHSLKVAAYTKRVAQYLGLSRKIVNECYYSALLHDIGKIGIKDTILNKKSYLNKEEWQEMMKHPELGAAIVEEVFKLESLGDNIMFHHKYYDGRGYPQTLIQGDEIPLGARIIAVCDAYDAMTTDRPYRRAFSKDEAYRELNKCAGTQFDPQLVEVFIVVMELSAKEHLDGNKKCPLFTNR